MATTGTGFDVPIQLNLERREANQARKEALKDSELQGKITDLINQRSALVSKISNLDKDSPEYNQASDALKQVNMNLVDTYHPQKNPNAIQKFGHLLTDHLGIKVGGETLPERRKDKTEALTAKKEQTAGTQSQQQIAGAPLSAAQLSIAEVNAKLKSIDSSPLSPEDKAEAKRKLFGVAEKPTLKLYASPDGGTKAWLDANRPDSIPIGWTAYAPANAAGTDLIQYNDAVAKGFKGSFLQWKAQQTKGGYKFDAATGQVVGADGTRYTAGNPNNPPEVAAMFQGADKVTSQKEAFQTRLAQIRGAAYGTARQMAPLQVLDTANGNAPGYATYLDMKKQPGRYIPATSGAKALSQENLIEDLTGVSGNLRKDINTMQTDFPEDMKLKIAVAARSNDPSSALDQLISSGALGALSDDQFQVYVDLQQLAENAMAMRSVLGAGQGSDDVRKAITRTLPSLLSPNKRDALVQLDAYDKTIARLRRGVPKVPLRTDIPQGTQGGASPASAPSGKAARSLAAAMAVPINKGKTEAQVEQDLKERGYTVTRP